MKYLKLKDSLRLLLGIILISACGQANVKKEKTSRVEVLPYYEDATFLPHWLEPESDEVKQFHRISPFQLTNQEGKTITEKSLENKIYVVDFFFASCPGICPQMTDNMKILQEAFFDDDEVMLISHTVTPERDSVVVLKKYAEAKQIDSKKWYLLTGERAEIYKLGRQDYFIEENMGLEMEPDDFLHTENFVLVDKNRHLRGIYNGLKKGDIQQIIADIKTLKKE